MGAFPIKFLHGQDIHEDWKERPDPKSKGPLHGLKLAWPQPIQFVCEDQDGHNCKA